MRNVILSTSLMVLLLMLVACSQSETRVTTQETAPAEIQAVPDKTFVLTGENFKFIMDGKEGPELRVKQGDVVRIEFSSAQGFHDWVVTEFNAATDQVREGESTFVQFVADKTGTYEYFCSVGSHRAQGMVGNLIVE